ncbi:MAG TPA: class I SAM-dependent methyltransferase [Longimicrobiales bacterium]|nr:class I SAM-dependent methyltransferase [Longimicrobiales bacterium]
MTTSYRTSHAAKGAYYDQGPNMGPWDRFLHERHAEILRDLVRRLFPSRIRRYMDFACGTGRITQHVGAYAEDVVGVDISASMLRTAREKMPALTWLQADLTREDPDLGTFDLVTAFRFFGNAEQDLRERAVRAIARRQEPGSVLIVNNHRNPNAVAARLARLRGQPDGMDLTHRKFIRLLEAAGYRIEQVVPIGVWAWRASVKDRAGEKPARYAQQERRWSAPWLAPIAPDCVLLAERV